jgi:hypothetical protein
MAIFAVKRLIFSGRSIVRCRLCRCVMTSIEFIFAEIERLGVQIRRQQTDILALQRSGASTVSAETLLERMRASIDGLCRKRDWMQRESQIDAPCAHRQSSALVQ